MMGGSPRWDVRIFALVACILMALSAYCLRWDVDSSLLPYGADFLLAGGLVVLAAMYVNGLSDGISRTHFTDYSAQAQQPAETMPTNIRLALPGIAALLLLIAINTRVLQITGLEHVSLGVQLALFVGAIVFVTLGLGGLRLGRKTGSALAPNSTVAEVAPSRRWYWIALGFIILLAFVVRAWNLGWSVHKFVDEIHFAVGVSMLRGQQNYRLFAPFSTITSFPWMFPLVQFWFVDLGGRNLESLRALSVVLGTLGVPALSFLAKTLFDRKTALIGALLLATFPPHIQFSRIALNNIADPLFGTLAIAFLVRGLKDGRRMDFALAGAALGLTQYFYEGGRFLFPILTLLWLAWHLFVTRQRRRRPTSPSSNSLLQPTAHSPHRFRLSSQSSVLSTFFLTALLIGLPLYLTLASLNHSFDERFQTVGVGGSYWFNVAEFGSIQTFEQQFLRPILVYVHLPETGLYYGGEQPLMLPYLVMFFLLGLFWLLWHWRSSSIVLLLWVLLTSLGNMLLTDGGISARYVVSFPALMLIAAVGIRYVLPMVWATIPKPSASETRKWKRVFQPLYFLTLVLAAAQVAYYFGPHLDVYNRQIRPSYDSEDAIFRAAELPSGTLVHIISDNALTQGYLSGTMGFLADDKTVQVLSLGAISPQYLETLPRNVNLAFFIQPDDALTLSYLQQTFHLKGPYQSPFNIEASKQLVLYYVPDILHP